MDTRFLDTRWIWHPQWTEINPHSAGGFVHFRKSVDMPSKPTGPVKIQITADTRYKLYINSQLVVFGPVKGDQHMWFYDEVDIAPYLQPGVNTIAVRVLRFYYATPFATSFPRLQSPGLIIRHHVPLKHESPIDIATDDSWETALDTTTYLPINIAEDDFLHIYEDVDCSQSGALKWIAARIFNFPRSHGLTAPWKLSPRLVPYPRFGKGYFKNLHNIRSTVPVTDLKKALLSQPENDSSGISLRAGSNHHFEIEAEHHVTALLSFRFKRPTTSGSVLRVTYSECYEDDPVSVPYLRWKGDRRDSSKKLLGPQDVYKFVGKQDLDPHQLPRYDGSDLEGDTFTPYHFRTFRFLTVDIEVAQESELVWYGIDMTTQTYPLAVKASIDTKRDENSELYDRLWVTSVRTLTNCLHDTYEDCPFYEQLQYAMDTRSSILFTYCVSNDDRLARQAIIQIHNTYQPSIGLTASRAPAHQMQIIPHFSLYWICMVADHHWYFHDVDFIRQFSHTCDGVLEAFARCVDPGLGLVRHNPDSPHWDFVDWADSWRPLGIPPAGARTGFLSYTSMLYAYTLNAATRVARAVGRTGLAEEYTERAQYLIAALRTHCFDGEFFTDGLTCDADQTQDYSQQTQIWAVLSGAASGKLASGLLEKSLRPNASCTSSAQPSHIFTRASTAMSFYALRALSLTTAGLYDKLFHEFWSPWKIQLSQNLSTWEEDTVSQRSDCHAWGCAALYEFTSEVAGVQPDGPGWSEIKFRPRLSLFADFEAHVPYGGNRYPGLAHVRWRTREGDEKVVEISLQLHPELETCDEGSSQPSVHLQLENANVISLKRSALTEQARVFQWIVAFL